MSEHALFRLILTIVYALCGLRAVKMSFKAILG